MTKESVRIRFFLPFCIVNKVAVTPDGQLAISVSNDNSILKRNTLEVWHWRTGKKVRILTGLEKEDFYRLSREDLEALVYDPVLIRFLFDSSKAPVEFKEEKGKPTYYEEISARMGRWSPHEIGGEA